MLALRQQENHCLYIWGGKKEESTQCSQDWSASIRIVEIFVRVVYSKVSEIEIDSGTCYHYDEYIFFL